jgi:hypothetical protein
VSGAGGRHRRPGCGVLALLCLLGWVALAFIIVKLST